MKTFIYPYGPSNSVKSLGKALRRVNDNFVGVIRRTNSKFKASDKYTVVNWGSYDPKIKEYAKICTVLNQPKFVALAACKAKFFNKVSGKASIPDFTTSLEEARNWVQEGEEVVGRLSTTDSGGRGIVLSGEDNNDQFDMCVLWTKYIPKKQEYRVHVVRGEVVDVQQKKLRDTDQNGVKVDRDQVNWKVRSYNNGFIFARENLDVPPCVTEEAVKAFNAMGGLDFGAFDVIYNKKRNTAYVLECNTAPGLEGTTLEKYTEVFNNLS